MMIKRKHSSLLIVLILLFAINSCTTNKFKPTVASLQQYETPEWFKNAKFGIWSCWNAYTVPGVGDWYARNMYIQGHPHYEYHVKTYGHPSEFGYKDIVDLWKGEKFNAEEQVKLFKRAGARYVIAMANHHDNFDLWDSKHQPWNSVNYGPKRDVIGEWREAVLKHDLRWGITTHAERTWSWLQTAKHADKTGPKAGVPYDGANPEYEQIYLPPEPTGDSNRAQPKNATPWWRKYWLDRCVDLIDNYKPDLFYVDGGVPFPGDDKGKTGLEMIAHLYNKNASWHNGTNEAVMCIKNWLHVAPDGSWGHYWEGIGTRDYERDRSEEIRKEPWQTDTSIGDWTWNRNTTYRSAENIIHELVDIVSKNGNLLLNVSPKDDGSLDDDAIKLLNDIGDWMDVNSESIYDTNYWKIPGMGDLRVVKKEEDLYVTTFKWPENNQLVIPFLPTTQKEVELNKVSLLGFKGKIVYRETNNGLIVNLPEQKPCKHAWVIKVEGNNLTNIDISGLDLRSETIKNKEAIKVWASVSKRRSISREYQAVESNGKDQQYAINKDGFVTMIAGQEEKVLNEKAIDVSCGIEETVVIVTPEGGLKAKEGDSWKVIPTVKKVIKVAVSPEGNIAVVFKDNSMAKFDGSWTTLKGKAKDIGFGPAGFIAFIGMNNALYVSEGDGWKDVGGAAKSLSVSPKTGCCVITNEAGNIWAWKGEWHQLEGKASSIGTGKSNDDEVIVVIEK